MTLIVEAAAVADYAKVVRGLRTARLSAGLTQNQLGDSLPVRGRAVSEWETGVVWPTLDHLILWAAQLDQRLVVVDEHGQPGYARTRQNPGESWTRFERRRLFAPLRLRRQVAGLVQEDVGALIGVTRYSIQRWELAYTPPYPIAAVVWARALGYTLAVRPVCQTAGDSGART